MNFDGNGSAATDWNWVAYEVVPAGGGAPPDSPPMNLAGCDQLAMLWQFDGLLL
jgi:hypothetical protein